MRALPLIAVMLAACSPLPDELWPAETHTFQEGERTILVRARWDPLERGWFTRLRVPNGGRLEPDDRAAVFDLVQNKLGPKICDGQPLEVEPEKIWSGHDATTIRYLPVNGEWQLVGTCA